MVQKIKTLSHCSIKKLFKLSFNKLSVFISLFLFSCTSHLIQAEEIKSENLKCGSNSGVTFFEKNGFTDFREKWNENMYGQNKNVSLISKDQKYIGKLLGINKIGELQIETDAGTVNISDINYSMRIL